MAATKARGSSVDTSEPGTIQDAEKRSISLQDYNDFMRRARWKAHQEASRKKRVENYLDVF